MYHLTNDENPISLRVIPTCFLTDDVHTVKVKCEGLDMEKLKKHLKGGGLDFFE